MTMLNRFSEFQYNNKPLIKKITAFEKQAFIQYKRGFWSNGLILENGDHLILHTYDTKKEVCESLSTDIAEYLGHAQFSINESNSAWLNSLAEYITIEHADFFRLGILTEITPHPDGIELYYDDSEYSEKLDDLGFDHTLDSNLYIDLVFTGIPEDTQRLIDLGLQEVPDDYSIEIFMEITANNKSIFSFAYQDSTSQVFTKDDLIDLLDTDEIDLQEATIRLIKETISDWKEQQVQSALAKLEALAISVRNNR
jgi:hypothetical protein